MNLYRYVRNRPLALTDPLGLVSCSKAKCAGAADVGNRCAIFTSELFSYGHHPPDELSKAQWALACVFSMSCGLEPDAELQAIAASLDSLKGIPEGKLPSSREEMVIFIAKLPEYNKLANLRNGHLWVLADCQKCKCTNFYRSIVFKVPRTYGWVPDGRTDWKKCDISKTSFWKINPRPAWRTDATTINFALINQAQAKKLAQECSNWGLQNLCK